RRLGVERGREAVGAGEERVSAVEPALNLVVRQRLPVELGVPEAEADLGDERVAVGPELLDLMLGVGVDGVAWRAARERGGRGLDHVGRQRAERRVDLLPGLAELLDLVAPQRVG